MTGLLVRARGWVGATGRVRVHGRRRTRRLWIWSMIISLVSACLTAVWVASAAVSAAAVTPVITVPSSPEPVPQNSGAFTTSIPIEVPTFHGVEPTLSLVYNSSAGNGVFGVGWQLAGESRITRVSPRRGAPTYTSDDIYLLDGEELVASTALGGTHATKRQTFRRITFDSTANSWTVRDVHGTTWTYRTTFTVTGAPSPLRWMLSQVKDLRGNAVNYAYWCNGASECYLDTISYNGTVITFYRQLRPDPVTQAAGGAMTTMRYRVVTIDVMVGASRARAYALSYASGPSTLRSLLTKVRQYGSNVTFDAAHLVTGGAALPPVTMGYQPGTAWQQEEWAKGAGCTMVGWFAMGDFDGDHKQDGVCHFNVPISSDPSLPPVERWLTSSWDSFPQRVAPGIGNCDVEPAYAYVFSADITGDGKDDLICHSWYNGTTNLSVSKGDGTFTAKGQILSGGADICTAYPMALQLTADDKADYLCWGSSVNDGAIRVAVSKGDGTFAAKSVWGTCTRSAQYLWELLPGDFNGDGLVDVACHDRSTGHVNVLLSNGSTGFTSRAWLATAGGCGGGADAVVTTVVDANGDSIADLACYKKSTKKVAIALSNGRTGFTTPSEWTGVTCAATDDFRMGDFDGDGRTDALCRSGGTGLVSMYTSNGLDGFHPASTWTPPWTDWCSGDFGNVAVTDQNADGRDDIACVQMGATSVFRSATYDRSDVLTTMTNPTGGTTTVQYGWTSARFGRSGFRPTAVTKVSTRDGRGTVSTTTYDYTEGLWDTAERRFLGFGQITQVNATGGGSTITTFAVAANYPANRISSITRKDASARVLSTVTNTYRESATGGVFTSLPSGTTTSVCTGASLCQSVRTTNTAYDGYGNVTQFTDDGDLAVASDNRTVFTTYQRDATVYRMDTPASVTVRKGNTGTGAILEQTTYSDYTVDGQAQTFSRWDSTKGAMVVSTATYTSTGEIASTVDESGHRARYTYDATHHLFPVKVCDGTRCATQEFDPATGNRTSVTDANGNLTTWSYDKLGRPTQQTRPDGATTTTAYLSWGDPTAQYTETSVSDGTADGLWQRVYVDGFGRTWKIVAEGGTTVRTTYNTAGAVAGTSNPYPSTGTPVYTAYGYDALGRRTTLTHPDSSVLTTSYAVVKDPADADFTTGRLTVTTCDEIGACRRQGFDGRGNVVVSSEWNETGTRKAAELRSHATYDAMGRLITVTDALGNTILTQSWDTLGRKASMTHADSGTWKYRYDDGGHLVGQTDGRGVTLTNTYDSYGRLTTRSVGANVLLTNTYDQAGHGFGLGQLTTIVDKSGSTSYTYDSMGRVTATVKTIGAATFTVKQSYDKAGRRASLTYPDGEIVQYKYDHRGCLTTVGSYVTAATCTPSMALATRTLGNGATQSYTYDPSRQWLTNNETLAGGGALRQREGYGRNPRGEVVTKSSADTDDRWSYGYDALGRLTTATNTTNTAYSASFGYDSIGRLTSGTGMPARTYPSAVGAKPVHAPATLSGASQTYDGNGNLLNYGPATYTYGQLNQLASVTKGTTTTTFTYDGQGHRVKAGDTTFVSLDSQLLYQTSASASSKFYYYGAERIARKDNDGKVYYYLNDQLGSPHVVLGAAGAVVNRSVHKPYGSLATSSSTVDDPFGLAGGYRDDTGLYYFGQRYLAPGLGQFISADTSGAVNVSAPQSFNLYSYAGNDPVNLIDPSGQSPIWAAGATSSPSSYSPMKANYATDTGAVTFSQDLGAYTVKFAPEMNGQPAQLTTGYKISFSPWSSLTFGYAYKFQDGVVVGEEVSIEGKAGISGYGEVTANRAYYLSSAGGSVTAGTYLKLGLGIGGQVMHTFRGSFDEHSTVLYQPMVWDLATGSPSQGGFGGGLSSMNIDDGYLPGLATAASDWMSGFHPNMMFGQDSTLGNNGPLANNYLGLVNPNGMTFNEIPGFSDVVASDSVFSGQVFHIWDSLIDPFSMWGTWNDWVTEFD